MALQSIYDFKHLRNIIGVLKKKMWYMGKPQIYYSRLEVYCLKYY